MATLHQAKILHPERSYYCHHAILVLFSSIEVSTAEYMATSYKVVIPKWPKHTPEILVDIIVYILYIFI